jgi:hypothetical protein
MYFLCVWPKFDKIRSVRIRQEVQMSSNEWNYPEITNLLKISHLSKLISNLFFIIQKAESKY